MAVSVLSRPSFYLFDQSNPNDSSASAIGNVGGSAFIQASSAHGLSNGAVVYIKCPIENYNGFFWVYVQTSTLFSIQSMDEPFDVTGTNNIPYVNTSLGLVTWYGCNGPWNWSCVHLPITYKLSNTLWPTNSEDTTRDITGVTDSNGYCNITAAGDIKTTGSAQVLDFVKITGCSNDSYNGVWQIVTYSSDTSFVINLPYSSGADTDLTNNGSIQYYYNNYVVKVQVWGGLNNGHEWYGQKPYELLATLNLIPDENNEVFFSVADILKKQIEMENNLLLGTLPNNLDAFTMFFIKYGEEYDDSTQIYVGRTAVSYTSDLATFEGKAMNAVLPFKNIHSGALSRYLLNSSTPGKFLTNFEEPVLFTGKYFDLGFLWDGINDVFFKIEKYLRNSLITTVYSDSADTFYTGVYRYEIEYSDDCEDYDRFDITAHTAPGLPIASAWTNLLGTFDSKTANQFIESTSTATGLIEVYSPLSAVTGDKVVLRVNVLISGAFTGAGLSVTATLRNNANAVVSSTAFSGDDGPNNDGLYDSAGSYNLILTMTATGTATRLVLAMSELLSSGTPTITITIPESVQLVSPNNIISETKTINLNCDCTPTQAQSGMYLSWINNLGHFDYWFFQAYKDNVIDITDSGETEVNIFPNWPNSYGEFADTSKRKQTFVQASEQWVLRAGNLSVAQVEVLKKIKTSPLVQVVNSIYDKRTVIVDKNSFTAYQEQNKQHEISFTITYTDDVPSQRV